MRGRSCALPPGFDSLYGLEVAVESQSGVVRGEVPVTEAIRDASGKVHTGVLAAIAVSLASSGTSSAVADSGRVGVAISIDMYFLEPIYPSGRLVGEATVRDKGPTEWSWDADITDGIGRLCAMGRVTVAVRPDERFSLAGQ